jgi:DNA-binding winged helix-turn-helix (wHTH) protein/predicted ATPase
MIYRFEDYELDTGLFELRHGGQPCKLEPQVFTVLAYLLEHRDHVVTKDELLDHVWPEQFVSEVTLHHRLMAARKAIGDSGRAQRCIKTLHGRGYHFIAEVTVKGSATEAAETAARLPSTSGITSPMAFTFASLPGLLVAREAELAQLHQALSHALRGERQVVFITGEAGMGKTALVDAFVAQVAPTTPGWMARGQCIEQYGAGEAYLPLLEALGQLGRRPDGTVLVRLLRQQAPSWLSQMPALLSTAEDDALQQRNGRAPRPERMLRELAEAVETLTAEHLFMLVLEDVHWSDTATIDWLAFVARRRESARLLILATYRPADDLARQHPVQRVMQELQRQGQGIEVALPDLPEAGVAAYLAQRFEGARFPGGFARVLHQRTNGNPFFIVTLVDDLVRQGILVQQPSGWTLLEDPETVAVGVPESARHLIEQQFEQLSPQEQEFLEAASIVGTEFSAAAVAAEVNCGIEEVEVCCDALTRHGQCIRPSGVADWPDKTISARYRFRHALYQEVLYERVAASRRARWHRHVGDRLETGYGVQAREIAAELAMHFVRGRDVPRAVHYLQVAGEQAVQRSAYPDAIAHLRHGLELLADLPDRAERLQQELALQTTLGTALMVTQGYRSQEVERVYDHARTLGQQLDDPAQLFPVLYGLYELYEYRGAFQTSRQVGEDLLRTAHRQHHATLLLGAHEALACTGFHLGTFAQALEHTEQGFRLYDRQLHREVVSLYGRDVGVACRYWTALALWFQGHVDQAWATNTEALDLARELAHPYTVSMTLIRAAFLGQFCRKPHVTRQWAEAAIALAAEHGFLTHAAIGTILQGWTLVMQGQESQGSLQIRQGLDAYQASGAEMDRPYFLALLAESDYLAGEAETGLAALDEAFGALRSGRDFFYEAELYRLQGTLLGALSTDPGRKAEACYQQALDVARRQQAKSLELRAATSLSKWWQQQNKRQEALDLLVPVYNGFTAGHDTADLIDAKALLDDLSKDR